jgi:hypothetical protein
MESVDSGGGDWSSKSDLKRSCLALVFAVVVISGAAHILSYFGVVVISDRTFQKWSTCVLFGVLMWIVFRRNRGAAQAIPWHWCAVLWMTWANACLCIAVLPIGGSQSRLWPAPAKWLHFEDSDLTQLYARAWSADQFAIALSLFLALWYQPGERTTSE